MELKLEGGGLSACQPSDNLMPGKKIYPFARSKQDFSAI